MPRTPDVSYIVEVQRRKEPFFARRAILSSSAEIIAQYRDSRSPAFFQPVHTLAFCDYDFCPGETGSRIGTRQSTWRDPKAGDASS